MLHLQCRVQVCSVVPSRATLASKSETLNRKEGKWNNLEMGSFPAGAPKVDLNGSASPICACFIPFATGALTNASGLTCNAQEYKDKLERDLDKL